MKGDLFPITTIPIKRFSGDFDDFVKPEVNKLHPKLDKINKIISKTCVPGKFIFRNELGDIGFDNEDGTMSIFFGSVVDAEISIVQLIHAKYKEMVLIDRKVRKMEPADHHKKEEVRHFINAVNTMSDPFINGPIVVQNNSLYIVPPSGSMEPIPIEMDDIVWSVELYYHRRLYGEWIHAMYEIKLLLGCGNPTYLPMID